MLLGVGWVAEVKQLRCLGLTDWQELLRDAHSDGCSSLPATATKNACLLATYSIQKQHTNAWRTHTHTHAHTHTPLFLALAWACPECLPLSP